MPIGLLDVINLDQADAGGVPHTADNRRVVAGTEYFDERGLAIIRRLDAAGFDGLPLGVLPVVVRTHDDAVSVYEIESRILQGALNARGAEGNRARARARRARRGLFRHSL